MLDILRKLMDVSKEHFHDENEGILGPEDFRKHLLVERARAERSHSHFTLIVFDIGNVDDMRQRKHAFQILCGFLLIRTRLDDWKGWFGQRIGLILSSTHSDEIDPIITYLEEEFEKQFSDREGESGAVPKLECRVYSYPGDWGEFDGDPANSITAV
jgi:hypothetical protein